MSDIADVAGEAIEVAQAEARARALGKSGPETHPDFDGEHCVDCEVEIPVKRLELYKVRCVSCQELLENKGRRGL